MFNDLFSPNLNSKNGTELKENTPLIVDSIDIKGNKNSSQKFVQSFFDPAIKSKNLRECVNLLNDGMNNLREYDIFSQIKPVIDINEKKYNGQFPIPVNVSIDLKEEPRYKANARSDISDKGDINGAISLSISNLFGKGEYLSSKMEKSFYGCSIYDISFMKRRMFNLPILSNVSIYSRQNDMSFFSSIKERSKGISFSISNIYNTHSIIYNACFRENYLESHSHIPNTHNGPSMSIIKECCSPSFKSSLMYKGCFTKNIDNYCFPTKGCLFQPLIELSGIGGDIKHTKCNFQLNYYYSINILKQLLTFSLKSNIGFIHPFSKSFPFLPHSTVVNDRFFIGGINSISGFYHNQIGPKDHFDNLGGELIINNSISLNIPFPKNISENLRCSLFAQTGNVSFLKNGIINSISNNILNSRGSIGIAFSYPINAIRGVFKVAFCKTYGAQINERTRIIQLGITSEFV